MFVSVLQNVSLLVFAALALYPLLTWIRRPTSHWPANLVVGIALGLAAHLSSSFPIHVAEGAVIDSRVGPMMFAGYLGGPVAALIAGGIGATAHILQGGPFVVAGIYGYFGYSFAGWAYRAWRLHRRREILIAPVPVLVLLLLSCVVLGNAYWLIAPSDLASTWFKSTMVFTLGSNVTSLLFMAAILHFVLQALDARRQIADLAERLDLATTKLGIGIWDWVPTAGPVRWNEEQYRLHGVDRATFEPGFDAWTSCIHPEDRPLVVAAAEESLATGVPFDTEYRVLTGDGSERRLKAKASVMADGSGAAQRMIGVNYDVSEIRLLQRRSVAERERAEFIADTMPGVVFQYTESSDGGRRFDYLSSGCEELWGLTREEIVETPSLVWEAMLDEDAQTVRERLAAPVRDGEVLNLRWRVRHRSGGVRWLHSASRQFAVTDDETTYCGLLTDVTEQVEAQARLEESHEMFFEAQKLESLGKLTGGVAHDFNNLLAVIMGNLELMHRDLPEIDPELYEDALGACERGAKLTQQLLSYSRRAALKPQPLNLNEVLVDYERMLRRTLPETIDISVDPADGLGTVDVDPDFLGTAILNLALNARDAMPDGGHLRLATADVRPSDEELETLGMAPGRYVVLSVCDDGTGMSASVLESASEPFFTTKPVGEGTGMGLSMVHGFVKQSNGALRIDSEPGVGTTVRLFFPTGDGRAAAERRLREAVREIPTRQHVLLVEDDERVRVTVGRMVTRLGCELTQCAAAESALEVLGSDRSITLLLTDVVMPGAHQGPGLARQARRLRPDLPVIFLSGYPQEPRGNGTPHLSDPLLMKPVQLHELAEAIQGVASPVV